MKKFAHEFFIENWQRKLISFILAIIIWLLVHHSLITNKTYKNVPVRVANIPKGMVVEGMSPDGFLTQTITLSIEGHKKFLDDLNDEDLQVVLNATGKDKTWVATINKNQIVFLNKLNNPYPYIRSIDHKPFVVSMRNKETQEKQ